MIKITSLEDTTLFIECEADLIQPKPTLRGNVETASITEHNKNYFTRPVMEVGDLNITHMTKKNYDKLTAMFFYMGNIFELESTDGDYFTKCYISGGSIGLTREKDKSTGEFIYSGTLPIGSR